MNMKREIKFRGKRKDNGQWIYGGFCKSKDNYFICDERPETIVNLEIDSKTLGQRVGIKDNDWIDIYEGDIVKADFGMEKMNGNGKVEWSDNGGYWKFISTKPHKLPSLLHRAFNIEIIGNIHDNPELLEQ